MKVELRHLDFMSWDLTAYRGSVCPACPKVHIFVLELQILVLYCLGINVMANLG